MRSTNSLLVPAHVRPGEEEKKKGEKRERTSAASRVQSIKLFSVEAQNVAAKKWGREKKEKKKKKGVDLANPLRILFEA